MPDDRLRSKIIEHLMCTLSAEPGAIRRRHGAEHDYFTAELDTPTPLNDNSLVSSDGGCVTVILAGRPFASLFASTFDNYLQNNTARHSKVVSLNRRHHRRRASGHR